MIDPVQQLEQFHPLRAPALLVTCKHSNVEQISCEFTGNRIFEIEKIAKINQYTQKLNSLMKVFDAMILIGGINREWDTI